MKGIPQDRNNSICLLSEENLKSLARVSSTVIPRHEVNAKEFTRRRMLDFEDEFLEGCSEGDIEQEFDNQMFWSEHDVNDIKNAGKVDSERRRSMVTTGSSLQAVLGRGNSVQTLNSAKIEKLIGMMQAVKVKEEKLNVHQHSERDVVEEDIRRIHRERIAAALQMNSRGSFDSEAYLNYRRNMDVQSSRSSSK